MTRQLTLGLVLAFAFTMQGLAKEDDSKLIVHDALMDHGAGHLMDMDGGMVMGQNKDKVPGDCSKISEDREITVRAGRKYAKPGFVFGFDRNLWEFKPCTRLKINFINEDNVRHQWMMHGLPKYIYQKGMFHLEITGPAKISGTLILPSNDKTLLVHCDIAQHMEKGMKGQLKIGSGSGDLPSIPGVTANALPDNYKANAPEPIPATILAEQADALAAALKAKGGDASDAGSGKSAAKAPTSGTGQAPQSWLSGMTLLGIAIGLFGAPPAWQRIRARSKDDDIGSLLDATLGLLKESVQALLVMILGLFHKLTAKK